MKHCKRCETDKPIEDFYLDVRRNQRRSLCKDCSIKTVRASTRNWRKENPESYKKSNHKTKLKSKYGLTLDGLIILWELQNKACAICEKPISLNATAKSSKPHIDHCHVTGVVRGLLCLTCNTGLGMFGDSENLLDKAKQYLAIRSASAVIKQFSDTASVSADVTITTNILH